MTSSTDAFRAARDLLLAHREDYDAARRSFAWPELDEFNWALDWFDVIAAEHPDRPALRILSDDGVGRVRCRTGRCRRGRRRSPAGCAGSAWRRGDRVLLMLGNVAPLWEIILATMKLGAVIIPASTLLQPADLVDRVSRGQVRHVITDAAGAPKFAAVPGDWTRIVVDGDGGGWHSLLVRVRCTCARSTPEGVDAGRRPAAALLHLRHHRAAQAGRAHPASATRSGTCPRCTGSACSRGDVHLNISSPGWAKHAWSNVFAPWNADATVLVLNYERFSRPRCWPRSGVPGDHVLRAAHGVADAHPGRPGRRGRVALRECVAAGEPLNPEVIEQVREAWGITVRDGFGQTETTAQVGNTPGQPVQAGLDGPAAARVPGRAGRPVTGEPRRDGEICLDLSPRPLGLMTGYLDDDDGTPTAMRGGSTTPATWPRRTTTATSPTSGRTDDVFKASDYRISPFELESVLIEHEAVAEAAVVPSPDPVRLAVPKAYVSLAAGRAPTRELAQSILRVLPGAARAVQADPAAGVRRPAEDDLRQDPPGGAARPGGRRRGRPSPRGVTEFWEEDFTW